MMEMERRRWNSSGLKVLNVNTRCLVGVCRGKGMFPAVIINFTSIDACQCFGYSSHLVCSC